MGCISSTINFWFIVRHNGDQPLGGLLGYSVYWWRQQLTAWRPTDPLGGSIYALLNPHLFILVCQDNWNVRHNAKLKIPSIQCTFRPYKNRHWNKKWHHGFNNSCYQLHTSWPLPLSIVDYIRRTHLHQPQSTVVYIRRTFWHHPQSPVSRGSCTTYWLVISRDGSLLRQLWFSQKCTIAYINLLWVGCKYFQWQNQYSWSNKKEKPWCWNQVIVNNNILPPLWPHTREVYKWLSETLNS